MEEEFYGPAYKGTKDFSQHDVKTANATGFGAAADDYSERGIDLNEELVKNKPATFFLRVKGKVMESENIYEDDVLVVDRSIAAVSGKLIVAAFDGELIVRRLEIKNDKTYLISGKKELNKLVSANSEYKVWGVVTYIIHKAK